MSWARRIRLGTEILVVYRRSKRAMKRSDIRTAIAAIRDEAGARRRPGPVSSAEAVRLGWAVTRTLSTLPLDDRCLAQSLVLTGLLARRQTPNVLVIGARPGADFGAHAWIEVDGVPVLATDDAKYPRLVEL
jgi:hypothetical protein